MMVGRLVGVLLLAMVCAGTAARPEVVAANSSRTEVSLNGAWTVVGDGFASVVAIPGSIPRVGGVTSWTRLFDVSFTAAPRVAHLHFAGVINQAVVRLNDVEIGTLEAFTDQRIDVTGVLRPGSNELVLEMDDRLSMNTIPGASEPLTVEQHGAFAYSIPVAWDHRPGIARDVTLVYSDSALVTDVFATPLLDPDLAGADLHLRVRVNGAAGTEVAALVALLDGDTVVATSTTVPIGPEELEATIRVDAPTLWSPANPHLYELLVVLLESTGTAGEFTQVDTVRDWVGIRKIEIRGNQFYLNGERLFLRGVSRHDLYGDQGFVPNAALIESDLLLAKALGVNFIRAIHYPPDAYFAKRADQLGILISEEIPAWANLEDPAIASRASSMVVKMIERDYNRPSVIMWFAGTAVLTRAPTAPARSYYPQVREAAKTIDAQRPVTLVFDNDPQTLAALNEEIATARTAGMDFYALAAYWTKPVIDELVPALPSDFPVLVVEWTGAEGSDRGPIGVGGSVPFPLADEQTALTSTGFFSEVFQAGKMVETFLAWAPHLYTGPAGDESRVAGMVYFNWQDLEWPSFPFFYPDHFTALRNGLVYEDRTPKVTLPVFGDLVSLMPGATPP